MRPDVDTLLGGRYRLVSRIAVGGMGEVWVAHDESLARDVAIKVLKEEFAGDEGFLERFRTEARNGAGLSHPNIAALYDYGEQDGSGFLVMELVLGEPMSDLLDRQPVLPTRRLLPILAQTARALHAAHVGGVVHRDVKPGNILLARSGRVKITDFGISTATNQIPMTASGMVMGTAQYLSPEQAIGRAATPASDVYSLGIVAYEALVGNRPFTGPTAVDIAVAHVNTPVPPMPDAVDPELADLVMRMLAKDPDDRPRSAATLARTLDQMLDRTPPRGIPVVGGNGRHTRAVDVLDRLDDAEARAVSSARSGPGPGSGGGSGTGSGLGPGSDGGAGGGTGPADADGAGTRIGAIAGPDGVPRATVVPGRGLDEALGDLPPGPPPSYTPSAATRRSRAAELAESERAERAGGARAGAADARKRTSTTTGRRWGQVSRPLVVLILMVLFALLGAAFADTLWGPSKAQGPPDADGVGPDLYGIVMVASADGLPAHGKIGPGAGATATPATTAWTTTARNL